MDWTIDTKTATQVADEASHSTEAADIRLMRAVAAGDSSALEQLLERHGPTLSRLIGRLLAWHEDSHDVFQEVWVTVWKRAGSWRGDGSLEGWLRRIAVRRCHNHRRNLMRLEHRLQRWVVWRRPPDSAPPSELDSSRPSGPLADALERLPSGDRRVVVLYYLEELPGDEVAKLLNIRPATLHVRLHRARQRLKQLLKVGDPHES